MTNDKVEMFKASDFDPGIGPAEDGKELCTYQWAARTANRLLAERSQVVYGAREYLAPGRPGRMVWDEHASADSDTHTALLVGIRPIVRDTAEQLMREFVEHASVYAFDDSEWGKLAKRMRAILERKEGE